MNKHFFLFLHRMVFRISYILTSHVVNMDLVILHTWGNKMCSANCKITGIKTILIS